MTQNQFTTYGYRHSEAMIVHCKHPERDIEMMLIGVDFDHKMFQLVPFDLEEYVDKSYWFPFEYVDKIHKKPKMKVIRGGVVNEKFKI